MKILKLICIALLSCNIPAEALILNVPSQYSTIQSAINASSNLDTILVQPGAYFENLNFRGKGIVLTSLYYQNNDYSYIETTIINGSNPSQPDTASCVIMGNHEDSTTVLQGFTLTGGTGTKWRDIHNSLSYREGGGVLMEFASPTIQHNIFRDNVAINTTGVSSAGGGAIRCGDSNPKILNNLIENNQGRYGAGIVFNYSTGLVRNNVIIKNFGGQDYGGSGVWMTGTNTATIVTVENNVIVNNVCSGPGARGGAIQDYSVRGIIRNNIIWGNTQTVGGPVSSNPASVAVVSYSDVEGGYTGEGNIDIEPLFDSTNYYLKSNSPCIDMGDTSSVYNDPPDPVNPTLANWPSRGSLRNDMGAYGGPGSSVIANSVVGIKGQGIIFSPENFYLKQNYPNPFNPVTSIEYFIPQYSFVRINIYNILGQRIQSLINEQESAGIHKISWNGENFNSGIYFYEMTASSDGNNFTEKKKMILLK